MFFSLLPNFTNLAELASVWASGLVLFLCGHVLCRGHGVPEIQIIAGWGGLCLVLTFWGVSAPLPLWWPAGGFCLAALVTLCVPGMRPGNQSWIALGRMTVLALPLWGIMLTALPSQPDTFLNLLPNAAYLYDHGFLPADGRPPSHSFLPGAPYHQQFWAYLAGLPLRELPASALVQINVLLNLLFGLLITRVIEFGGDEAGRAPGWSATALGLLAATALNPGFVPRIDFASYGEGPIAVTLGAAGWLAARNLTLLAERDVPGDRRALALILAALVNIKQESIAFVLALAFALAVLGLADRRVGFWRVLRLYPVTFLPAVAVYGAWRWYTATHLAQGELTLLPLDQWQPGLLPAILASMTSVIENKGVYFGFLLLAFGVLAARLARRGFDEPARLLAILAAVFVAYNGFLLFMYVAHFRPEMDGDAHSYFRYTTHLSLLLVIGLVGVARDELCRTEWKRRIGKSQIVAAVPVVLMLCVPIAFAQRLRFDLVMPQPLVRTLGRELAGHLGPADRGALVLPGDNGSVGTMLQSVLRYAQPRRPGLDLTIITSFDDTTLPGLSSAGIDKAFISCTGYRAGPWPSRSAVYLERTNGEWHQVDAWPYPDRDKSRWSPLLAPPPLCGE